jgi:hypothetical protein
MKTFTVLPAVRFPHFKRRRLQAAGFVTACRRDGSARIATLAAGATLREDSDLAGPTAVAMEHGLAAIKRTLESAI